MQLHWLGSISSVSTRPSHGERYVEQRSEDENVKLSIDARTCLDASSQPVKQTNRLLTVWFDCACIRSSLEVRFIKGETHVLANGSWSLLLRTLHEGFR